jgi:DNA invertase Pin-like site-specific DNA recombinase
LAALSAAKVERLFSEQMSALGDRKALEEAINFSRDGDIFVVTKIDRLARSVSHLCQIVDSLHRKNVALRILDLNLDTGTATGRLMVSLLAAISEFERSIMLERQKHGIAAAKLQGKYRGRVPSAMKKANAVRKLLGDGLKASEVAKRLLISRASVYRIKAMNAEVTQSAQ